jgi:outer membrane protein assembly factor BamE (lipoprotein component of BamABCDE complex)
MYRRIVPALLLSIVFLSACVTVGWDFPADRVKEVENGKTTKAELLDMFGPPYQQGLENGHQTWTYVWIKYGSGTTTSKELHIKFDQQGMVESYSFSTSIPKEKQ